MPKPAETAHVFSEIHPVESILEEYRSEVLQEVQVLSYHHDRSTPRGRGSLKSRRITEPERGVWGGISESVEQIAEKCNVTETVHAVLHEPDAVDIP
jgi:hypothetical protein